MAFGSKIKKTIGKVMRKQSELPYIAKHKLEQSVSSLRRKNKTFNSVAKGISKAYKVGKKVYNSKAVKGIGKVLDVAEKVPVLGSELKGVRKLGRGVLKDPFALKTNLLNLAQVTPIGGFENAVLDTLAGKAKDKLLGRYENKIKKMDQDAKKRVEDKYKPKEPKPYKSVNNGIVEGDRPNQRFKPKKRRGGNTGIGGGLSYTLPPQ